MTESKKNQLINEAYTLLEKMKRYKASANELAEQQAEIAALHEIEARPCAGTYGFHN